jgi:hypothetical protein
MLHIVKPVKTERGVYVPRKIRGSVCLPGELPDKRSRRMLWDRFCSWQTSGPAPTAIALMLARSEAGEVIEYWLGRSRMAHFTSDLEVAVEWIELTGACRTYRLLDIQCCAALACTPGCRKQSDCFSAARALSIEPDAHASKFHRKKPSPARPASKYEARPPYLQISIRGILFLITSKGSSSSTPHRAIR